MNEVAVVAEEDEAFAVFVEAADWFEVLVFWDEVEDGLAIEFVFDGGDVVAGFVESEIDFFAGTECCLTDADLVGFGID